MARRGADRHCCRAPARARRCRDCRSRLARLRQLERADAPTPRGQASEGTDNANPTDRAGAGGLDSFADDASFDLDAGDDNRADGRAASATAASTHHDDASATADYGSDDHDAPSDHNHSAAASADTVISVVVPLHNEERSIALLYEELQATLDALGQSWEAVFVDDGSVDGSFAALTRLHEAHENVRVVRLRRNFGKAAALATGFAQAQGETVVTIDADLQDDPAEIPRLLVKLEEGFDLVSGWKTRRRDPLRRRVLSRIFNWVTGRVSGLRLHDMNCGLKAYRSEVVRGLRLYGELHRFIPVLAHYRGFRIAELPVNHRPREHGRSRYGVERYVRGFLDLLTVSFIGRYRHRPLHLFGGLGLVLGAIGFVILVYLTIVKLLGHAIGERPLLTLGVLLVVVGLQFFSLGLISEMLTSQHEETASGREQAELHIDEVLS
jgi:glycosyltransferase involved in cell wall biosynthesis